MNLPRRKKSNSILKYIESMNQQTEFVKPFNENDETDEIFEDALNDLKIEVPVAGKSNLKISSQIGIPPQ